MKLNFLKKGAFELLAQMFNQCWQQHQKDIKCPTVDKPTEALFGLEAVHRMRVFQVPLIMMDDDPSNQTEKNSFSKTYCFLLQKKPEPQDFMFYLRQKHYPKEKNLKKLFIDWQAANNVDPEDYRDGLKDRGDYFGQEKDGEKNGFGIIRKDNYYYQGGWKDNVQHGYGAETLKTGTSKQDTYAGHWHLGKKEGLFIFESSGELKYAQYKNDMLVEGSCKDYIIDIDVLLIQNPEPVLETIENGDHLNKNDTQLENLVSTLADRLLTEGYSKLTKSSTFVSNLTYLQEIISKLLNSDITPILGGKPSSDSNKRH